MLVRGRSNSVRNQCRFPNPRTYTIRIECVVRIRLSSSEIFDYMGFARMFLCNGGLSQSNCGT